MISKPFKLTRYAFTPFPAMDTPRLFLRQLQKTDALELFSLHTDKTNARYIDRPVPDSIDDIRKFIYKINNGISGNQWVYWAICLKKSPVLAGTICLWNFTEGEGKAELGYELKAENQGLGIMSEALTKVLEYGFATLSLKYIDAYTHAENVRSTHLLEKHDFGLQGWIEEKWKSTGEPYTMKMYRRIQRQAPDAL